MYSVGVQTELFSRLEGQEGGCRSNAACPPDMLPHPSRLTHSPEVRNAQFYEVLHPTQIEASASWHRSPNTYSPIS